MKIDSDQNGYAGIISSCAIALPASTTTPVQRENWFLTNTPTADDPLEHADAQHDPAPRVEAAGDVVRVGGEEVRVADRGETLDEVQGPEHQQQHAREHDPAIAALVVLGVAVVVRWGLCWGCMDSHWSSLR